jgi:hypothetical protein
LPEILSPAGIGAVLAFGLLAAALLLSTLALACLRPAEAAPARPLALLGLLPAWLAAEACAHWTWSGMAGATHLGVAALGLCGLLVLALASRAGRVARAALLAPEAAQAIGLPLRAMGRGALALALVASLGAGVLGGLTADLSPAWCLAAAPLLALDPRWPLWAPPALAAAGALVGQALAPVAPSDVVPLLSPAMVAAFAWLAIGLGHRRAPGHA